MPDFRRAFVPGGTFFFTVVTDQRAPFLCGGPARRLLHEVIGNCRTRWPMHVDAIVLLPDHLHTIWTLPRGDTEYSKRWAFMKKEFTKAWLLGGNPEQRQTAGRLADGRRGVWQPKFWEHSVRDDRDFARHVEYIHYNPVKHGLRRCPHQWPWSSFRQWVRAGVYSQTWGCACSESKTLSLDFSDIEASAKE